MSVQLGLESVITTPHVIYASIIIIIDVHLVIFNNGVWIILGSNTINDKSILLPRCRHANYSHKRAVIVAISLWLKFVNKIVGGTVSCRCWYSPSRCAISLRMSWTPVQIVIPCHLPFTYTIIYKYYTIVFSYYATTF